MSYRDDANRLLSLDELVDDSVGADAKRTQSPKAPAQHMAGERIALEQTERILDGIDERPTELEQLTACPARQDDTRHRSAGSPPLIQLGAQVVERDVSPRESSVMPASIAASVSESERISAVSSSASYSSIGTSAAAGLPLRVTST